MKIECLMILTILAGLVPEDVQAQRDSTTQKAMLDPAPRVSPNRTPPKVSPPPTGLEFSANPTGQEISQARVFEEPLVPVGGAPGTEDNAALAAALMEYAKRSGPDDFSSLTAFLDKYPKSSWQAALLTCLGLEYYNTAHYSLSLEMWEKAWPLAKDAIDLKSKAIADRAVGELALMYARLGRMAELEALLKSVEDRTFRGAATEKITGAREGLWNMQNKPEISFKCGPYALQQILMADQSLSRTAESGATEARREIANAASTQKGMSLAQVAELSRRVGLDYQMAFRTSSLNRSSRREKAHSSENKTDQSLLTSAATRLVVPSVVHWKVGHYAALVRQEGERYLLEDPTFGTKVWATREALEAETSGYFLIPAGDLPQGWRSVDAQEGATVWGKGQPPDKDPDPLRCKDPKSGGGNSCDNNSKCKGMAVSDCHLMLVSLNIVDTPVGYSPPVGPSVEFTVAYNQRDANQPANFTYSNLGPKWTFDWLAYITDNSSNALADVKYYAGGGGARTFTGFNSGSQTFAFQQYDQTLLRRTTASSYEMTSPDGSKMIFNQPDGSSGVSRKIFLSQIIDPFGNAVTLTYDGNLRVVAITDAIGQVTTLTYGNTNDIYKITRVTDPFGRFAQFAYDLLGRLTNITDVIGINSTFVYPGSGDFISQLITPYGTNTFIMAQGGGPSGTTRSLETIYADGSRDRVEYNQSENLGIPTNDPPSIVPTGMAVNNQYLHGRNTYHWSRTACASSYGDYSKAKIYHWLHAENLNVASGILESTKEALENRVWYNYQGQTGIIGAGGVGTSSRPTKVGRVLDDGQTQLYTFAYDGFGHVTNSIDPIGRTFSYIYSSNGIDLLEIRQTRAGNNELLFRATYNAQHLPLAQVGVDGQTNAFTYNSRGQLLTETNPKGETTSYTYDTNEFIILIDGPLSGTNDLVKITYDGLGRMRTKTDESGYTLIFEYDDMDRLVKILHPDSTFDQFFYNRLDVTNVVDRAGRQTIFEFDNIRQMKKKTDPLGQVTLFEWCRCGNIKSLTDPMGRTTTWLTDVQSRPIAKQYGDGSQVTYLYENASSRVRQKIDEKQQITQFSYNLDDTLKSVAYANTATPTPSVSYSYDPAYQRRISMTDGAGTTLYSYNPVTLTPTPGANQLASVDGPLANDTVTYAYDELGRHVSTAIDGMAWRLNYDAAGRVISETNALGAFVVSYDGASHRIASRTLPNGQTEQRAYGQALHDFDLERISHKFGAAPISEFLYEHDHLADRITSWSQQAGALPASIFTFAYDAANQLLSAVVTNSGSLVNTFAYAYDPTGNRFTEKAGASTYTATYNALNQISASTAPGNSRTNQWDAKDRLVAVIMGNQRTEFTYDGRDQVISIRQLTNGVEASLRRFVWCENVLREERDAGGTVTKRFFDQGIKIESGINAGTYFYTRDHLGSIREVIDSSGAVRTRYSYDPYGRRSKLAGDLDVDFGFAGLYCLTEPSLCLARFRAYDPDLGRWLSRDPLRQAELEEGANLYAYVKNNPINATDLLGLCCENLKNSENCEKTRDTAYVSCMALAQDEDVSDAERKCEKIADRRKLVCRRDTLMSERGCLDDCKEPTPPTCPKNGPNPKPRPGPKPGPKPKPHPKTPGFVRECDPKTGKCVNVLVNPIYVPGWK
jgi:RHS repeat-associated protein